MLKLGNRFTACCMYSLWVLSLLLTHEISYQTSSIIFLLGVIITFEFFNEYVPYRLYWGGTVGNHVPLYNPDTFRSVHEAGEQLFRENCKSCHKIHTDAVGPALHGVTERRPREWIYTFIQDSPKLIADEDTMAVNVYNTYNKAQMTSFPTLTKAEIDSILIYIEDFPVAQPNVQRDIIVID